jgi:hypothetical protein
MPVTLASQRLLEIELPQVAQVLSRGEAVVLVLDRLGIQVTVTVPTNVLEWWVEAASGAAGLCVKDWCDYQGYDSAPWAQLDLDMAADVTQFVAGLLNRELRLVQTGRPAPVLEWVVENEWCQAVPLKSETLAHGV